MPKAIVGALATVASAAFGAFNTPGEAGIRQEAPPPRLFRLVQLSGGDWALVGGAGLSPSGQPITIKVTKSEEPKEPAPGQKSPK